MYIYICLCVCIYTYLEPKIYTIYMYIMYVSDIVSFSSGEPQICLAADNDLRSSCLQLLSAKTIGMRCHS